MKIVVTGGTGDVGTAAVRLLVAAGHELIVLGRSEGVSIEGAEYRVCDVTDFDRFDPIATGADAIVHLAAIRSPMFDPPRTVIQTNTTGALNVYQAAENHDVPLVVTASSINAFGFRFGIKSFPIERLPIDETHPTFTTDSYSFSKEVTESLGAYYWRRREIRGVALRLPWVYGDRMAERALVGVRRGREQIDALMRLSPEERRTEAEQIVARFDASRTLARAEQREHAKSMLERDPLLSGYADFWTGLHDEDGARLIVASLTADYEGFHPLFTMEHENVLGVESAVLADAFFPDADASNLHGKQALVSSAKAKELLGWQSERTMGSVSLPEAQ